MKLNRSILSQTLTVVLVAVSSVSATELSLSDCLRLARTRSPQIIESGFNESKAKAAREEASRQNLPLLSANGNLDKSDDASTQLPDANKAVVRVEQSAYPFSPAAGRSKQKQAEYESAQFAHLETVQDIDLQTKKLYFNILKSNDSIRSMNQVEEQLNKLLESVIPKFVVGRAPPFDSVKTKIAISDLARAREQAQVQLVETKSQLARLLGIPPDSDFSLKATSSAPTVPEKAILEASLLENPSLQVLSRQILVSKFGLKAAQYARAPNLLASTEYGYTGQTTDEMSLGWDVAIALRLPLFDWGTISSQIEQERAGLGIAQNKSQSETWAVAYQLKQVLASAQAHLSDQRRLLKLIPEVHDVALASINFYRKGSSSILETSDSVNLWLQTLLNERSAYYAYLSDLAQIERLAGEKIQIDYGN